ncbi:uncharacterized protein ATNIH1004_011831 [Aspergillus tanneri]|uniref:Major facilitator superfamily (MFS) profile domain-containing protein n=1 Tax=Aspergillus tanneri TaxID=1220188 RepID=A0A5M9M3Y5_9EURO|nr:uncharacterized protein ATNIH1004_011831 [Aspergillus tanneri]KAA8641695.1 hypothetical protein ATNIH1004_011831 [Aspergillus tanneri]
MSWTLVGDVVISLSISVYSTARGAGGSCLGSLLMAMSGYVFAPVTISGCCSELASLEFSPSGADVGPFKAVEESAMAQLMPAHNYNVILSWYYMLGSWGAMIGTLSCGWLLQLLEDQGWGIVDAYRCVFWIYAAMGLVKLALSVILSREYESHLTQNKIANSENEVHDQSDRETEPLLHPSDDSLIHAEEPPTLVPSMNASTRNFVWKLCLVLILDSIGSGLSNNSWMAYYFNDAQWPVLATQNKGVRPKLPLGR